MAEPVTLEEVKNHLGIDEDQAGDDDYLAGRIVAARRACEKQINRTAIGGTGKLVLDTFPRPSCDPQHVARPSDLWIELAGDATAVTAVSYRNATGAAQQLDPALFATSFDGVVPLLAPVSSWPQTTCCPGAVAIAYTAGGLDDDDLALVAQAMLLLIEGWYANRGAVQASGDGASVEMPLGVRWLLEPLRVPAGCR